MSRTAPVATELVIGVNYHPSAAGCNPLTDFDLPSMASDFHDVAATGLNTVRLFCFWRELQPRPDEIDGVMLSRLRQTVEAAGDAGLRVIVSLLTIWMNGQRLDPPWRAGRSLFRDPFMRHQADLVVGTVAEELSGFDHILAFDLGDEIVNAEDPGHRRPTPEEAGRWCAELAETIRRSSPGRLVMQANDVSGVLGDSPFGPDTAGTLDLVAIHGFPLWSPGAIESTASERATRLVPFLVDYAAAFGEPLIDELGCYGADEETTAGYLRVATVGALAHGAVGVLVWCWKDIESAHEPYEQRPSERSVGLVRLDGTTRSALDDLITIVDSAHVLGRFRRSAPRVTFYLGTETRSSKGSYLDPESVRAAAFHAHVALDRAGLPHSVTNGQIGDVDLVLCPSLTQLTLTDLARLRAFAESGGVVYLSIADHVHGLPGEEICGARCVDFSLLTDRRRSFRWSGETWPVDWGDRRSVTLAPTTATVLAQFEDGSPAMLRNRIGDGSVVTCAAPFEAAIDRPGALTMRPWERFYAELGAMAGLAPVLDRPVPTVEAITGTIDGCEAVVLINHADEAVGQLRRRGALVDLCSGLAAKGWCLIRIDDLHRPEVLAGDRWSLARRQVPIGAIRKQADRDG